MSDDRLAGLIADTEHDFDEGEYFDGQRTYPEFLADAIRAAVAADPSIVGMTKFTRFDWPGSALHGLWVAPEVQP